MASFAAQNGEYSKEDKLSDVLIMQAFLFTKTRDIKYAKNMDNVANMAEMSGSITCTGNLSVYMFFKFDAPLSRELIAEVQNEFLERVDLEPPSINEIALAHKMGNRLPSKNLHAFLMFLGADEPGVPMTSWEHAKLVSTIGACLDEICDNPYYRFPKQDRRTAAEPPLNEELGPGHIGDNVLPVIANLTLPLEA